MLYSPNQAQLLYRVAIIDPSCISIALLKQNGGPTLPSVPIPANVRPVRYLQSHIERCWGIFAGIVELIYDPTGLPLAVMELVSTTRFSPMSFVSYESITPAIFSVLEMDRLTSLLHDQASCRVSRFGWITEAIQWTEDVSHSKLHSSTSWTQHNAGGGFALLRFTMSSGRHCWLKATGAPNLHERRLTAKLSELCSRADRQGSYIPEVIADREDWNAWLMDEAGFAACSLSDKSDQFLSKVIECFAQLQCAMVPHTDDLLFAGAFDHRLPELQTKCPALFEHLHEVLDSIDGRSPVTHKRLDQLRQAATSILSSLQGVGIPETLVHADLNWGNILAGPTVQFIDWSDTYIGCPLTSIQQLLSLSSATNRRRLFSCWSDLYVEPWRQLVELTQWSAMLRFAPSIAAISLLFGRFDWKERAGNTSRRSYVVRVLERLHQAVEGLESGGGL